MRDKLNPVECGWCMQPMEPLFDTATTADQEHAGWLCNDCSRVYIDVDYTEKDYGPRLDAKPERLSNTQHPDK